MFDFERARAQMVDGQLRTNDVTDHDVLRAFLTVPREAFVGRSQTTLAYRDHEIALTSTGSAAERYLTDPRALGRMIQELAVTPSSAVLVVGCGTGYAAAILSNLADSVIALESDPDLAARATEALDSLDISNVVVVEGELTAGYPDQAPFDAILIDGAIDMMPDALPRQLAENGRLVTVLGVAPYGKVQLYVNENGGIASRAVLDANAPLLPGFERKPEFVF